MPQALIYFTLLLTSLLIKYALIEAIVCYKCDSVTLEACAMSLNDTDLPIEDCKSSSLHCTMSIVDTVTYRGCGANTPITGAAYKKTCTDNLCNSGVYPPGRPKCYHCQGYECIGKPQGKPHPCRVHMEVDQCYTEVVSAGEVYRGCKSDTNHTITGPVKYCDINGCNDQVAAIPLKCVQCDSTTGRGCKMDLFEVHAKVCNISIYNICEVNSLLTQKESCFLYRNLNRVVRGCSSIIPPELIGDQRHLEICTDKDYCNNACVPQLRCVNCDSTVNELCRSNATRLTSNTCPSPEASSCYACEYNDWTQRRGCGAPPTDASAKRCYECSEGFGCNDVAFSRCYKCTSATDPNCANWQRPTPGLIEVEECVKPGAACIALTYANDTTVRGCESDQLYCNETPPACMKCEGSFCNKGPFPPQRLHCYQCGSSDLNECPDSLTQVDPMPCTIAALEKEACFEYYNNARRRMTRGCRSQAELYYDCLLQTSERRDCRICYEDGCNHNYFQSALSAAQLQTDGMQLESRIVRYGNGGEMKWGNLYAYIVLLVFVNVLVKY